MIVLWCWEEQVGRGGRSKQGRGGMGDGPRIQIACLQTAPAHCLREPGPGILTLYPDLFQLRHLSDGLLQVFHELLHLVRAQGTEVQHLLLLQTRQWGHQCDAVRVVWNQPQPQTDCEQQWGRGSVSGAPTPTPSSPSTSSRPLWSFTARDLHSFSKRWNCMPSRPTDLQNVYVEALFFFGHSLRIYSRGTKTCTDWGDSSECARAHLHEHPRTCVNTQVSAQG